jgi:hypothetical protein
MNIISHIIRRVSSGLSTAATAVLLIILMTTIRTWLATGILPYGSRRKRPA